jgi:hypothetical protein
MATSKKRAANSRASARKKSGSRRGRAKRARRPKATCDITHVCAYLAALDKWLQNDFLPDYTRLRKAVCNVERKAWGTGGTMALRFCTGGPAGEPADPTPPPIWGA